MSTQAKIDGVARSAARLRWIVIGALIVMLSLYVAARFHLQLGRVHVEYFVHGSSSASAQLIGDGTVILLGVAVIHLILMLGRIARGELFSAGVVRNFRGFALWLLLMAVLGMVGPFVAELAAPRLTGHHLIRIAVDLREVLTLGITLLLFLFASLLERARRLDEEMREFV
jgi:hypothetical protein